MWGHRQWPWALLSSRRAHCSGLDSCNRCLINAKPLLSSFARVLLAFYFHLYFKKGSHYINSLTSNLPSSCLHVPTAGITSMCTLFNLEYFWFCFEIKTFMPLVPAFLYNSWWGAFHIQMFGIIWVTFQSNSRRNGGMNRFDRQKPLTPLTAV